MTANPASGVRTSRRPKPRVPRTHTARTDTARIKEPRP
ncbi:hypothetical protein SALBM217S_09601 [Streptomyces griseoloalbus]